MGLQGFGCTCLCSVKHGFGLKDTLSQHVSHVQPKISFWCCPPIPSDSAGCDWSTGGLKYLKDFVIMVYVTAVTFSSTTKHVFPPSEKEKLEAPGPETVCVVTQQS